MGTGLPAAALAGSFIQPRAQPAEHPGDVAQDPTRLGLLAKFYRALGDPTRLALLQLLAEKECTGSECVEAVGLSQGRVSAHLACLVSCGLATVRRKGRFAYYRAADPRVTQLLRIASSMVVEHAETVAACVRVAVEELG